MLDKNTVIEHTHKYLDKLNIVRENLKYMVKGSGILYADLAGNIFTIDITGFYEYSEKNGYFSISFMSPDFLDEMKDGDIVYTTRKRGSELSYKKLDNYDAVYDINAEHIINLVPFKNRKSISISTIMIRNLFRYEIDDYVKMNKNIKDFDLFLKNYYDMINNDQKKMEFKLKYL